LVIRNPFPTVLPLFVQNFQKRRASSSFLTGNIAADRHLFIILTLLEIVSSSEGTPVTLVLSSLLVAAALLVFSLYPDAQLAARSLSAVTAFMALSAAVSSLRALMARKVIYDPLLGAGSLYAAAGFALAAVGWALDAAALDWPVGPIASSKLAWYSSGLILILALWELSTSARIAAGGLEKVEKMVALAVPIAYASALTAIAFAHGAPLLRLAEIAISATYLGLSLSALLPIRRKRYSWGLTLLTIGSAVFLSAVALVPLAGIAVPSPLPNALYALAFAFAATGLSVYRKEKIVLK
jgi:hypothetical protein